MSKQREIAPIQTGARVWRGETLQSTPDQWSWKLTDEQVGELVEASRPYADSDPAELSRINAENFFIPALADELARLSNQLLFGRGFEVINGFPSYDLSAEQLAAAFVGIGAHLGVARSQNAAGDLLGHVLNVGARIDHPETRIYQTNIRQSFHTDSTDVVGLLCLETAASGGASLLASIGTIYNEILRQEPALAAILFEPIATDRRGEVPIGAGPFFEIPVFNWFENALTVMYQRQYIESAQRFDEVEVLADQVVAALDMLDEIANDPAVHLRMDLEVGDMQFVYNHAMLHDRTGFVDRPGSPRHLLRLWLSMPGDRRLPPVFAQRYGSIAVGDRGGIVVTGP